MIGQAATDRRTAIALTAGVALLPALVGTARATPRKQTRKPKDMPFNEGWLFRLDDGEDLAAAALDDSDWNHVDLPHDWSLDDLTPGKPEDVSGPFSRRAIGKTATGFTQGGQGWYRKHFRPWHNPASEKLELTFDAVYLECDVFLNGHRLGGEVHGYVPFTLDLTPHLKPGEDNVLAVRVRNLGRNSRWYSGSGIYRPVTIETVPVRARIARDGVFARTTRLTRGKAEIAIDTHIEGDCAGLDLVHRIVDADGRVVAVSKGQAARDSQRVLALRSPRLWSPDTPALYRIETELVAGSQQLHAAAFDFGVRIIFFDSHRGMTINGKQVKLRGGCIHHDNGLLGACAFADADERRVRLLKARGFNAVRSAHNPASGSLREACDRLGMLLIEEAFDVWHVHKEPQDFALHFRERWEAVIRAMVLPARNNACVIMWSIGNEIPDRASDEGIAWEWKLANAVKKLDATRPVTAGLNGVLGQEVIAAEGTARPGRTGLADNASTVFLDVPGYNYRLDDIEREQAGHPERVVYASETFPREVFDYAALADRAPWFLGEFVWTAMDYVGEAGIGATAFIKNGNPPFYIAGWPWVNAWCGDIDLIGEQKPASLARDVAWGLSSLEMTVRRPAPDGTFAWTSNWGWPDEAASWTWPGYEGRALMLRVYTRAERVELHLDGRRIAERAMTAADKSVATFEVPYAPGTLEAVAYEGGRIVGRRQLVTTGPAASLRLMLEPLSGRGAGESLAYLRLEVLDAGGRVLPDDDRAVSLAVAGAGRLAALGNANPLTTGPIRSGKSRTFRGRALGIVRSTGAGVVTVTAHVISTARPV